MKHCNAHPDAAAADAVRNRAGRRRCLCRRQCRLQQRPEPSDLVPNSACAGSTDAAPFFNAASIIGSASRYPYSSPHFRLVGAGYQLLRLRSSRGRQRSREVYEKDGREIASCFGQVGALSRLGERRRSRRLIMIPLGHARCAARESFRSR
jgi:hypothetical protein